MTVKTGGFLESDSKFKKPSLSFNFGRKFP